MSADRQRILVLGAAGLVGRRVVAALAGCGWAQPVAAVHRQAATWPEAAAQVRVDATDSASLAAALEGADGVVNCVTGSREVIQAGAAALAQACSGSARRALRLVHMSSMAVYGSSTGTLDESAPLRGDIGPYSAAKVEAERHLGACGAVLLRPGIVFGPHSPQWSGLIGRLLVARRLGNLGQAGEGICNLIYVDDLAVAAVAALRAEGAVGQAYNLAVPDAPSWNRYFEDYAQALGAGPAPTIGALRLALELRLIGPALKLAELASGGGAALPPPIRPWLTTLCRHRLRLDVGKAGSQLLPAFTPLPEAYRLTAQWYRAQAQS